MGNQVTHRSSSVESKTDFKDEFLPVKKRKYKERSSTRKKSFSADEKLLTELRNINILDEMKKIKDKNLSNNTDCIPTVFRWNGNGESIYISGSFNNWKEKILLTKSDTLYYTIINCTPGHHTFKFLVDGNWVHDTKQPTESNAFGTLDNWVEVNEEDYDIDLALSHDEKFAKKSSDVEFIEEPNAMYGQKFPRQPNALMVKRSTSIVPKFLPPYLNETVLNIEECQHNDPSLLRTPVYVQLNHLYALSITDGIAALSVTVRYRTKFITTVFYKPIS